MSKRVSNYTIDEKLDKLFKELNGFKKQYEVDMRGDKTINGNIGIIGEIRALKKLSGEYPSLTWLITHRPKTTIGAIMIGFSALQFLMTSGAVWLIDRLW